MDRTSKKYQVVIVGGGPIGLFLGICLQRNGISCLILEKCKALNLHSRSIGLHPVSLELLDELNMAECFLERGIKIKQGHAISGKKLLGTVSFHDGPKPYNYILSLPQSQTEQILQEWLIRNHPGSFITGAEVTAIDTGPELNIVSYNNQNTINKVQCEYVIGCDGKNSIVRKHARIAFDGKAYPDTYIMGDYADNTRFGDDAVIYLHSEGLVESFPLPGSRRRWVIKTDEYIPRVQRTDIELRLQKRIGHDLFSQPHFMLSSFGVQKMIARIYTKERIALAGDAAHIVSPIGGQGMNLGWMDAWELAKVLNQIYASSEANHRLLLERYSRKQQRIARKTIRRAEFNTRLGRKTNTPGLKNAIVWLMLNTPLHKKMVQTFTMRNLY